MSARARNHAGLKILWCLALCGLLVTGCTQDVTPTPIIQATPHPIAPEGTQLLSYNGHPDPINVVAWSPDGTMLASGGYDQTIQVWNATSGQHIATYHGHSNEIVSLAWSPDGKYIASCDDEDYSLHIWNSQTGQIVLMLPMQNGARSVSWSPNGKFIAVGSDTISVWNVSTHQFIATYTGVGGSYLSHLAWSPDGTYLAASDSNHAIQVWNALNSKLVYTYHGHTNDVNSLAWSPDSREIVSGSTDGTAQVWDATTGKLHLVHHVTDTTTTFGVHSVAWSPDGTNIATVDDVSATGTIIIWNAQNGKIEYTNKHDDANLLAWSPDGSRIANDSGSNVIVWQVGPSTHAVPPAPPPVKSAQITHGTGTLLMSYHLHGAVKAVAWSPDNKKLAAGDASGLITIWDSVTHKVIQQISGSGPILSLAWSPDGRHLATAADQYSSSVAIWDMKGTQIQSCMLSNDVGTVNAIAWSPDGKQLALAGSEAVIDLCNTANGQVSTLYQDDSGENQDGYLTVCWSPDSREVAFGGGNMTFDIIDAVTKKIIKGYLGASIVYMAAWSPDGRYVASGGYGGGTTLLHPGASGDSSFSLAGDTGATVSAASWSPKSNYIAIATRSGLVQIGSLVGARIIFVYSSHFTPVFAVAWSPNGQAIASADQDGNVLVWQAPQ